MSASELKPAYIVSGDDRPKVETALERLRARFDSGAIERFVAASGGASGVDVVAACNAGSLLGDGATRPRHRGRRAARRLGRLTGGWKAADSTRSPTTSALPRRARCSACAGEELKVDSPLGKVVAKVGDVLVYTVGKDLDGWIAKRFREHGIDIGRDACQALREIVGDEKLLLDLEIDKLLTWAAASRSASRRCSGSRRRRARRRPGR